MFITALITWRPKSGHSFSSFSILHIIHCISETSRKLIAKKEKAEREKASEGYSISLKQWRQAFRGQCRAPRVIPRKGGKYKMCPK